MAVTRFTTTKLSGLQAAGRSQELQHSMIAPYLERELGPEYGRLFAEFEAEGSDIRAWYVDANQPPRPIETMSAPEQVALRQRVADMMKTIIEFAERIAPDSPQKANEARILTAATTFPLEDIWAVGDQPVIVNWGYHRQTVPPGIPQAITELFRVKRDKTLPEAKTNDGPARVETLTPPVAETVAVAARPRPPFLAIGLWVLFVALVAGLYALLLPACAVNGRWHAFDGSALDACVDSSEAAALADEGIRLQGLVEAAEDDVARQQRQCAIDAVRPPTQVPGRQTSAEVQQDIERRLPPDAPRGDVEVSLIWTGAADLDLIIECPDGKKLWHSDPAACGGRLLRDVNKAGEPLLPNPIEHAAWASAPPSGPFTITVQLYGYNSVPDGTDIPFTIMIRKGDNRRIIEGGHVKGARTIVTSTTTTL